MSVRFLIAFLCCVPVVAHADVVIAARTIRAQTILMPADLSVLQNDAPGRVTNINDLVGLETRVVLYEGRPVGRGDVGPAAVIERNQIVTLIYRRAGLSIAAEARSLGRAGVGETVRVINLSSRTTVAGTVAEDGAVLVGADQ